MSEAPSIDETLSADRRHALAYLREVVEHERMSCGEDPLVALTELADATYDLADSLLWLLPHEQTSPTLMTWFVAGGDARLAAIAQSIEAQTFTAPTSQPRPADLADWAKQTQALLKEAAISYWSARLDEAIPQLRAELEGAQVQGLRAAAAATGESPASVLLGSS